MTSSRRRRRRFFRADDEPDAHPLAPPRASLGDRGAAGGTRQPPELLQKLLGSRRATHSYGHVLALIVASIVFASTASDARWTGSVLVLLQTATLVAALWTSGIASARSRLNIGLIVLAVSAAIVSIVWEGEALAGMVGALSGLLTLAIAVVVAASVVTRSEVDAQSIEGAICVYLLLGIFFMFIYGLIALFGSVPLFAEGTDGTRSLRVYFSYVTLATLGYGDYTPAGNFGHLMAVAEALIGQLYLVTVVAILVARVRPRDAGRR